MSTIKTKETTQSVTAFINSLENEQQKADSQELVKIFKEVTKKTPKLWSNNTIGFDSYSYKTKSGSAGEWFVTGFSPRKAQFSIYIMTGFKEHADLLDKLGTHKISGGSCLYVKKLSDISVSVLKQLVKKSIADKDKLIGNC